MGVQLAFNPTQFQPSFETSGGRLPTGKYSVTITDITAERTKDQTGGLLKIEFTVNQGTPQAGRKAYTRLNLWNASQQAAQIAHQQMSALCYCVGIFQQINDTDQLKNRQLMIEIVDDGQYSNVTTFMDANGQKPGQQGQAGAPQMQQGSPQGAPQQPQFAQQGAPAQQQPMPQFQAPAAQPNPGANPFPAAAQGGNPFQPPASNQPAFPNAPQGFPQQAGPGQPAPWNGGQQPMQQQQPQFGQQAYQPQGMPANNPAQQFQQQPQQQQAPQGWPGQ